MPSTTSSIPPSKHRNCPIAGLRSVEDRGRIAAVRLSTVREDHSMSDTQITVTKTVDASPEQLFALLSQPVRHPDIDGANMLRGTDTAQVSGVGDEFIMKMNNDVVGDYEIKNRITAFEENRKIGWAPSIHPMDGYTDKLGDVQVQGHTYTWQLEPAGGGTKVTQTYDWSGVTDEGFLGFLPLLNEQQLSDSIDNAARAAS
jgi:uncharacterized protein YndB with AHSA1/START domain